LKVGVDQRYVNAPDRRITLIEEEPLMEELIEPNQRPFNQ